MTTLSCILYVSSAAGPISEAQIDHLLTRARARNTESNITGILLHRNGSFMQYIEGMDDDLQRIYTNIKNDPLHKGIIELLHEPIQTRAFPQWAMAYRTKNFQAFTDPDQYALLLDPALAAGVPETSPAVGALNAFWNGN